MFVRYLIRKSSNHEYSFHTQRVFTQDWLNSFWITIACSVLPFIWKRFFYSPKKTLNKSNNFFLRKSKIDMLILILWPNTKRNVSCSILPFISHGKQSNECTSRRISLPSRNLYKCKQVACNVVVACLFVYLPVFFYYTSLYL